MSIDYARSEHHEFLPAVDRALADANLQLALANLGDTLSSRGRDALASLPDGDLLRQRGRAIKNDTLLNLDRHLATLIESVERRGGHVHLAADAAEAREMIVDIVRRSGGRR